jgi:hypothetical protein
MPLPVALMETKSSPAAEQRQPKLRCFHLTPDRFVIALLVAEGFLLPSERFHRFAFNAHKGWTVLIAIPCSWIATEMQHARRMPGWSTSKI